VQVWSLSIDVHVLDNGGNLADACMLCTLAALMAFRRPNTEVAAGGADSARMRVTVLSPSVREPVPLSLHHLPLAISFAFFEVRITKVCPFHSFSWQQCIPMPCSKSPHVPCLA
jgi:exosome complex RNA-binding protein Rrp42 (RNase PH superfamily)